jgi:hypothetical protein
VKPRWVGPGNVEVEHIILDGRSTLRVCWRRGSRRYVVAYCRSIRELTQHVELADLVEVIELKR